MESSRLLNICLVTSTPRLVLWQCRTISVAVLAADIWLVDGSWQWDFVSSVFFVCLNFATSPSSHSNMQLESRQTMCHTRDGVLCWGLWQSDAWTAKYLVLCCISKGGTIPEQGEDQPCYSSLCWHIWPGLRSSGSAASLYLWTTPWHISRRSIPSPVVNTQFSISHFLYLSSMHQYPQCHLPVSWLPVIDIHQTFPHFWNASFSVKLHSWNVLNVWNVFLLDLPICCILVELIRWSPCMSVPTWNPVDFESSA